MIIEGFISHAMSRAGSVRGSEYKRFHLPTPLTIPPSKRGPFMIIEGFISHSMSRAGSVRGSEYKPFHLPAPLTMALLITESTMNRCFFKIP